jgi:hypothetical protein
MEASTPPHPAINLSTHLYYQLVYTLTDLLPPPLDGSADLAPSFARSVAQCIAARAQAEDCGYSVKTRMTSRWSYA